MLEGGATALGPCRSRLEWIGPIAAETQESGLPSGPIGRALDILDIVAAGALSALFAVARNSLR